MKREYREVNGVIERRCCKCQKWRSVSFFYKRKNTPDGLRAECIECFSGSRKVYYQENKAAVLERNRNYARNNQEFIGEYKSRWQRENSEKRRVRLNQRYKEEPNFRIAVNLRTRILKALGNDQKTGSTLVLLGCSVGEFRTYLERKFKHGMSWGNHGSVWHIDHIKPCSSFDLSDPKQQAACFHFTNMQPLYAKENLIKGSRC